MPRSLVTWRRRLHRIACRPALSDRGHDVVVLDDLSGGYQENVPAGAAFCRGSVTDGADRQACSPQHRFDYVYHLAAYAAEGLSHFIRRYNYQNNVIGTVNLINAAVNRDRPAFRVHQLHRGVRRRAEPDDARRRRRSRRTRTASPSSPCEMDLRAAHEMFGLNYTIFRPHNVYGEHQNIGDRYRNVIGIFMNQIMQGQPMTHLRRRPANAGVHVTSTTWRRSSRAASMCRVEERGLQYRRRNSRPPCANWPQVVATAFGVEPQVRYLEARKEVVHAFSSSDKLEPVFGRQDYVPLEAGVRPHGRLGQEKRGAATAAVCGRGDSQEPASVLEGRSGTLNLMQTPEARRNPSKWLHSTNLSVPQAKRTLRDDMPKRVLISTQVFPPMSSGTAVILYELLRHLPQDELLAVHGISDPPFLDGNELDVDRQVVLMLEATPGPCACSVTFPSSTCLGFASG